MKPLRWLCRDNFAGIIRRRTLVRFSGIGILLILFMGFVWTPVSQAGTEDRLISIVANPERDCGQSNLVLHRRLEGPNSKAVIRIDARSFWNASGLFFEKDVTYRIQVMSGQDSGNRCSLAGADRKPAWYDADQAADSCGWLEKPKATLLRWFVTLTSPLKRVPEKPLFYLMGAIYGKCEDGKTCAREFSIGSGVNFTAPADGEFCSFANDLPVMYWNNSGTIYLQVTRK